MKLDLTKPYKFAAKLGTDSRSNLIIHGQNGSTYVYSYRIDNKVVVATCEEFLMDVIFKNEV